MPIEPDPATPLPFAALPDRVGELLRRRGAAQINLYRVLANSPEAVEAWLDFLWSLRDDFVTPRALRELVILRVATREGSPYEWHHHVAMARAAGVPDAKIDAVRDAATGHPPAGDSDEALALRLADAVAEGSVTESLRAAALERFGPARFVELAVTAATYVMVARVIDALAVPIESGAASGTS